MTTEALVVTRSFPLHGDGAAATALRGLPGVEAVQPASGGRRLRISYDLRRIGFAEVERALGGPAGGLAASVRRGWAVFTERNILASARAEARPCCSRPPDGA